MNEKSFKGFNPGLTCLKKQYKENTVFEESGGNICNQGVMHYCKDPLDVLDYYPLLNNNCEFNEFAEVEPMAEEQQDGNKFATTKLKIKAKFSFAGFVKACINFVFEKTEIDKPIENENVNNDNYAQLASSGDGAKLASSGDRAKLASSGYGAQLASSGDGAKLASSGYRAQLASSGYRAQLASSGDRAKLASSGDGAKLASSGDYQTIVSDGENAIICCAGHRSKVKTKKGSFITLAEWVKNDDGKWIPLNVKTVRVDGKKIKEDTFYTMRDGEIVEVEE